MVMEFCLEPCKFERKWEEIKGDPLCYLHAISPRSCFSFCRTQMNLARQWHDDSTSAVSNVEPNTVAPELSWARQQHAV